MWDTAIIGAGAAGLMCAYTCSRAGLKTLLLDSKEKIGAKILMSGGTRCNVTNRKVLESDFFTTASKRLVRHILQVFPPEKVLRFFKEAGVEMVLEENGKFFPSTHSGRAILDALTRQVQTSGVFLEAGKKVARIQFKNTRECFVLEGNNFSFDSKTVVLTTGGLSYPATGSDGTGYQIAESFGHRLIPCTPALSPLLTRDETLKSLSGISLPVRLALVSEDGRKFTEEGDFLFTHFGFSGPTALNLSRHWVRQKYPAHSKIFVNFLPGLDEGQFIINLVHPPAAKRSKRLAAILSEYLPNRLGECLLRRLDISLLTPVCEITRDERRKLIQSLFHFELPVSGIYGYLKAEVTAGGVNLAEIDPRTMESAKQGGLFFAGEILDVDGRIGGFNFQWAWSSGTAAGIGVIQKIKSEKNRRECR